MTVPADPEAYIAAHDERVKHLDRMSVPALRAVYRQSLAGSGFTLVYGGPVSKDEFVSAIIEVEFPDITGARAAYAGTEPRPAELRSTGLQSTVQIPATPSSRSPRRAYP